MINKLLIIVPFYFCTQIILSQNQTADTLTYSSEKDNAKTAVVIDTVKTPILNPLSPSKAAFYSAVLPGLGQAYNKKYWKIPIVYGALGTGIYFYKRNDNLYNQYRDAYKSRLAGYTNDEFYGTNSDGTPRTTPLLSDQALRDAQNFYQRNRDLSLLITIGLYVLNIIDANVDAHLKQYNVNDNLSFEPFLQPNQVNNRINYGMLLTLNF